MSHKTRARLTILGGLIIHSCMSLILVWGTIQPYFISFFRSFDKDLTMAKASMMVPCAAFAMGVFNLIAMRIANKIGVKLTATLAITFYSICLILMGKILIFFFAFLFVTVAGAGYGICMVTTFYAGWTYYPKNKGMVASIMLSSHGFLGVAFNYIILFIMNPDNKKADIKVQEGNQEQDYFDSEIYNRTPHMLLVLGSGSLVFGLFGAFMITINPQKQLEDKKREEDGIYKELEENPEMFNSDTKMNSPETIKKQKKEKL